MCQWPTEQSGQKLSSLQTNCPLSRWSRLWPTIADDPANIVVQLLPALQVVVVLELLLLLLLLVEKMVDHVKIGAVWVFLSSLWSPLLSGSAPRRTRSPMCTIGESARGLRTSTICSAEPKFRWSDSVDGEQFAHSIRLAYQGNSTLEEQHFCCSTQYCRWVICCGTFPFAQSLWRTKRYGVDSLNCCDNAITPTSPKASP